MREIKNGYKISVGKPEGKRPLGRTRHRQEISKLILKKYSVTCYAIDSNVSEQRSVAGFSEHDNELSISIKGVEFLNQPSDYQFSQGL
jgi:hypothetical protein